MISSLLDAFAENWESWGGTWEKWENPIAARLALLRYLQEQRRTRLLAWQTDALLLPGLAETLADVGVDLMLPHRRNLNPEIAMGVTAVDAALATPGSLALVPAPGRSWLPALIPIHHVALLPTSRLHADLRAWRKAWRDARAQDLARALIISGPSVSDDIELSKHYGMFGPRYVHVILFDD